MIYTFLGCASFYNLLICNELCYCGFGGVPKTCLKYSKKGQNRCFSTFYFTRENHHEYFILQWFRWWSRSRQRRDSLSRSSGASSVRGGRAPFHYNQCNLFNYNYLRIAAAFYFLVKHPDVARHSHCVLPFLARNGRVIRLC